MWNTNTTSIMTSHYRFRLFAFKQKLNELGTKCTNCVKTKISRKWQYFKINQLAWKGVNLFIPTFSKSPENSQLSFGKGDTGTKGGQKTGKNNLSWKSFRPSSCLEIVSNSESEKRLMSNTLRTKGWFTPTKGSNRFRIWSGSDLVQT